ncbi:MAG: hypothetical protein KF841_04770 [Phycisphaerae bacterium]|nr:hypothetical protein [Phycisphaerae bacterium]
MVQLLHSSPFFLLFGLIAAGISIGAFKYRGLSLSSAGVFFLALIAGHFQFIVPYELTELGLVLFVYAVGLQSGSRFFRVLKSHGLSFLVVGLGATLVGALTTIGLARLLNIAPHLAGGLYAGSTTCTPGLAAVLEAVRRIQPANTDFAAVGYAIGYPFSVISVVIFVQLLPRIMGTTAQAAGEAFQREQAARVTPLERCAFRITNPNCAGITIDEWQALHLSGAVLCRVEHEGHVQPARPGTILHMGDVVLAVGPPEELAKLEAILGTITPEPKPDGAADYASELVVVSRADVFGKRLRELRIWEKYGVTATRLRRGVVEITPRGETALEPGDVLRLVGGRADVRMVTSVVGLEERRLDETSMIPFAAGITLGAAVGFIPISLPGGLSFRLGIGGGAFIVALIMGYVGHVGKLRIYVPNAAKHFARELGLVIFLAGAGTSAGQQLVPVLREAGVKLLLAGAIITLVTTTTALLLMWRYFRWNPLFAGGGLSAVMTSPPGLSAASDMTDTDAPAVGFASVYPLALLAKIALAPLTFLLLDLMGSH